MRIDNGINTILNFLSMFFKKIEDIEDRVDKKRIKLSLANTNRLKVFNPFTYTIRSTLKCEWLDESGEGQI